MVEKKHLKPSSNKDPALQDFCDIQTSQQRPVFPTTAPSPCSVMFCWGKLESLAFMRMQEGAWKAQSSSPERFICVWKQTDQEKNQDLWKWNY